MVKTKIQRPYVTFGSLLNLLSIAIGEETNLQPSYLIARVP
jgi:hypothetical protein